MGVEVKPEEIRIAIAEKCGWTQINSYSGPLYGMNSHGLRMEVPNYPEDLNACHEMIKILTNDQLTDFIGWICAAKMTEAELRTEKAIIALKALAKSEAVDWCEAFCRVFWPERFND